MTPSTAPLSAPTATRPAGVPFASTLGRFGEAPAVVLRDRVLSYRELAARVDALAARLGPAPRLVALAAANDLESARGLPCRPGGRPPGAPGSGGQAPSPRLPARGLRPRRRSRGGADRPRGAAPGQRPRPAPGPRPAAEHLGLHRLAEAGAAVPREPAVQRGGHRELPADRPGRPRGHDPADALLLRPVGDQQPPAARGGAGADRPLRGRPRFWDRFRAAGATVLRRRALHLRPARPRRVRGHGPARACATSPRPAAGWPRTRCAGTPSWARRAAGSCS